jgi:hypothetical protein
MRHIRQDLYSIGKQLEDLSHTAPDLEIRFEVLRLSKELIKLARTRDWIVPESEFLDEGD